MPENHGSSLANTARYLREVILFAICYLVLDWASFIEPVGHFNITPWNPPPALAIVWMTLTGIVQWPVVFLTLVLGDIVIRDAPGGYAVTAGSSFTLAVGYAAIAFALRRGLRDRTLHSTRDLAFFAAVVVVGSAIVGGAYVNVLATTQLLPGVSVTQAWLRFWLGDAVGILVTAPLLFAVADNAWRARLRALWHDPQAWLEWAMLCGVLVLVFHGLPADITPHFYVVFVPIIWIAMRSGMAGAIVATVIVQLAVIVALEASSARHLSIVEIQLLVCILCVTGLFIGAVVDERRRSEAELRAKLDRMSSEAKP